MTNAITEALTASWNNDLAGLIRLVDWDTSMAVQYVRAIADVDPADRARLATTGLAGIRDPDSVASLADRLLRRLAAAKSAHKANSAQAAQALADLAVPAPPSDLTAGQRQTIAEFAESAGSITDVHMTDNGIPLAVGADGRLVISIHWLSSRFPLVQA